MIKHAPSLPFHSSPVLLLPAHTPHLALTGESSDVSTVYEPIDASSGPTPLNSPPKLRQPTDLGWKGEVSVLKVCWLGVGSEVVLCIEKGEGGLAVGVGEAHRAS